MKNTYLFFFCICFLAQSSFAQSFEGYQKKALLIGNYVYKDYPHLPNTKTDINLLGNKLYSFGFEVTMVEDSHKITQQVQQFYAEESDSVLYFLYYAGYVGAVENQPVLVSVGDSSKKSEFLGLSEIIQFPKAKNSMNFLVLDWASLNIQKEIIDAHIGVNWEKWRGKPKDNFEIQDYVSRTFPNFTEKNVLVMHQKSFHRNYSYVEKLVESLQNEYEALQKVFNKLEFDIPRTHSILGGWGTNDVLTRSFFSGIPPSMPAFPFPPPDASAHYSLPNGYFRDSISLYDVNTQLLAALEACYYYENSYHQIPKGFAMVTRIEKIKEDGTPYPDTERWEAHQPIPSDTPFSFFAYFRSLFQAKIGTYRIIVFLVTSEGIHETKDKMSMVAAKNYLSGGWKTLPNEFKEMEFTDDYHCAALIYEFVKHEHEEAILVTESKHLGKTHLEKSNFLKNLAYLSDK